MDFAKLLVVCLSALHSLDYSVAIPILCYKCNSALLAECGTVPAGVPNWPTEECNSLACAVTIVDGDTYRGCADNTPRGQKFYKSCQTPLCNGGVYPPGRLKCYQCEGPDCVFEPDGRPMSCRHHDENDQCYTLAESESRVARGCVSNGHKDDPYVAFCGHNGCNNQTGVISLECTQCDSLTDRDCKRDLFNVNNKDCAVTNENRCTVHSLLGRQAEQCFVYHNLDRVVRGCSDQGGSFLEQSEVCSDDLCNKKCLGTAKCKVCSSETDPRCQERPEDVYNAPCVSADVSSCHTCELEDGTVVRGCGTPKSGARCTQCQGDGCNKDTLLRCYACASDSDPNCSQWTNPSGVAEDLCSATGDECATVVKADGHTARGCRSALENECLDGLDCQTCKGSLCNGGADAKRLRCYQCEGDCQSDPSPSALKSCVRHSADNRCFEYLDAGKGMVRGCTSDRTPEGPNTRECSSDGCNNSPATSEPQLACHKCSTSADPACGWSQLTSTAPAECLSPVDFGTPESCYVQEDLDAADVQRGCTLDDRPVNKSFLSTCRTSACNHESVLTQSCFQCTSIGGLACAYRVEQVTPRVCERQDLSYDLRGCYVKKEGFTTTRGCVAHLTRAEADNCQLEATEGTSCIFCTEQNCNTMNAPGISSKISKSYFLIILTVLMNVFCVLI